MRGEKEKGVSERRKKMRKEERRERRVEKNGRERESRKEGAAGRERCAHLQEHMETGMVSSATGYYPKPDPPVSGSSRFPPPRRPTLHPVTSPRGTLDPEGHYRTERPRFGPGA